MFIKDFQDLIIWQKAHVLVKQIYYSVGNYKISSLLKILTQQRRHDERSEEFS